MIDFTMRARRLAKMVRERQMQLDTELATLTTIQDVDRMAKLREELQSLTVQLSEAEMLRDEAYTKKPGRQGTQGSHQTGVGTRER